MAEYDDKNERERDRRPVPDPTILTTQQLQREVAALKEIIFTRLDANDKAVELLHADVTRVPTDRAQITGRRTGTGPAGP